MGARRLKRHWHGITCSLYRRLFGSIYTRSVHDRYQWGGGGILWTRHWSFGFCKIWEYTDYLSGCYYLLKTESSHLVGFFVYISLVMLLLGSESVSMLYGMTLFLGLCALELGISGRVRTTAYTKVWTQNKRKKYLKELIFEKRVILKWILFPVYRFLPRTWKCREK